MELDYRSTQLQGVTDLTVVARIKQGAVPGALNTFTYVDRLRRVLKVLNSIRQAGREAALDASPFPDSVARFRTVHFFRFAILPATDPAAAPQLLLNVTVDGGWEPYMRFIWKPMGSMLDLIFCHCDDYPLARLTSFADYIAWVRDHEVVGRFFFADSGATAADSHYHKRLTDLVLEQGNQSDFDAQASRLAEAPREANPERSAHAADIGLRALHAVAGLRELFPERDDRASAVPFNQEHVLRRFAQDLFADVRRWCINPGQLGDEPAWRVLRQMFEADMAWLALAPPPAEHDQRHAPRFSFEAVQAGIARPFPADVTHGALVLLRVTDAALARRWLANEKFSDGTQALGVGAVYQTIAVTYDGMQRLGAPRAWCKTLPREFIDGMEARAGVLGDVHANHPDHWRRPPRNWPLTMQGGAEQRGAPPLDINAIDLVLQMRVALDDAEAARTAHRLAAVLEARIAALAAAPDTGVEVLSVEPMRHHARLPGETLGRDHFGYVDGLSQPSLEERQAPSEHWRDKVEPGEILLGYANNRGDEPHAGDALLDNGSFLVVRKLRQHTELFEERLKLAIKQILPKGDKAARARLHELLMAKLMGRHANGKPLTTQAGLNDNDFTYRDDRDGAQCPLQSHVRRANPREPVPPLMTPPPRIARRGMSYGPRPAAKEGDGAHGLIFMAYNASIAEQFEVIQNWVAGGSPTGLPSSQHDPLLGVPAPGRSRIYRFMHEGQVLRIDLGETPLVSLEWGVYAFAPSLAALRAIATLWDEAAPQPAPLAPPARPSAAAGGCPLEREQAAARLKFEDESVRALHWAAVREAGGMRHEGAYGWLVGSAEKVMMVLKDDGRHYSAAGYGPRMAETVGTFYLGQDDVGPYDGHAELGQAVNDAVEKHLGDERSAYALARDTAIAYLDKLHAASQLLPKAQGASVDLLELARYVMAALCGAWFGLPDGKLMRYGGRADDLRNLDDDDGIAHCPGDLMAISRYVFGPHPQEDPVATRARVLGERVKHAFAALVARPLDQQTPLVRDIMQLADGAPSRQAALVAGVMLGFPAPTIGSLAAVLVNWSITRELWRLQQSLAVPAAADFPRAEFTLANDILRQPLLTAMAAAPAPYAVWRRTAPANPLSAQDGVGCPVVVGLASAMRDPALHAYDEPEYLMFGGTRQRQHPLYAPHACPGYGMAMGAMLGVAAALLRAGELCDTPDPRVLTLKR